MHLPLKQRLIALLLLMAYTITGTSIMPAALALAAWVEGSHAVMIRQTDAGTSVTLHHRRGTYTPDVSDHQSSLAKVLVSFCRSSEAGDHQLSVSRCVSTTTTYRETLEKCIKASVEVNHAATFQFSIIMPSHRHAMMHEPVWHQSTLLKNGLPRMLTTVRLLI